MKKTSKTLALAMGTTLITGLTSVAVNAQSADSQGNTFQMTELSSGYMQLAAADAATANVKPKSMEGKCAGAKPISAPKAAEGKCGEGKCGGTMKAAESAKTAPVPADSTKATAAPASVDKSKEGKCGEGKCGSTMKKATDANPAKK
jgi:uncharacterized low-complexity protein